MSAAPPVVGREARIEALEREIVIAKAQIHAVGTSEQLEHAVDQLMRMAYDLGATMHEPSPIPEGREARPPRESGLPERLREAARSLRHTQRDWAGLIEAPTLQAGQQRVIDLLQEAADALSARDAREEPDSRECGRCGHAAHWHAMLGEKECQVNTGCDCHEFREPVGDAREGTPGRVDQPSVRDSRIENGGAIELGRQMAGAAYAAGVKAGKAEGTPAEPELARRSEEA